jgi:glycosyltransferase involved in cell wall biosynthesis
MAMEIPCIATQVAGIPELVRDGIDGLLVAPSDEHGLAGAIARLMDDPELRLRLGRSSRRRVVEEYDIVRNLQALEAILRRRVGDLPPLNRRGLENHQTVQ